MSIAASKTLSTGDFRFTSRAFLVLSSDPTEDPARVRVLLLFHNPDPLLRSSLQDTELGIVFSKEVRARFLGS